MSDIPDQETINEILRSFPESELQNLGLFEESTTNADLEQRARDRIRELIGESQQIQRNYMASHNESLQLAQEIVNEHKYPPECYVNQWSNDWKNHWQSIAENPDKDIMTFYFVVLKRIQEIMSSRKGSPALEFNMVDWKREDGTVVKEIKLLTEYFHPAASTFNVTEARLQQVVEKVRSFEFDVEIYKDARQVTLLITWDFPKYVIKKYDTPCRPIASKQCDRCKLKQRCTRIRDLFLHKDNLQYPFHHIINNDLWTLIFRYLNEWNGPYQQCMKELRRDIWYNSMTMSYSYRFKRFNQNVSIESELQIRKRRAYIEPTGPYNEEDFRVFKPNIAFRFEYISKHWYVKKLTGDHWITGSIRENINTPAGREVLFRYQLFKFVQEWLTPLILFGKEYPTRLYDISGTYDNPDLPRPYKTKRWLFTKDETYKIKDFITPTDQERQWIDTEFRALRLQQKENAKTGPLPDTRKLLDLEQMSFPTPDLNLRKVMGAYYEERVIQDHREIVIGQMGNMQLVDDLPDGSDSDDEHDLDGIEVDPHADPLTDPDEGPSDEEIQMERDNRIRIIPRNIDFITATLQVTETTTLDPEALFRTITSQAQRLIGPPPPDNRPDYSV